MLPHQIAAVKSSINNLGGALDSAWLCLCGALVMFMHAGFAMLETGCCRAKNASNVLMKNLVNVCCGTLGWWSLGWAFAYGGAAENGFIGTTGFFGTGFYTQDSTTGIITPVTCDESSDGCQSTMLSWFFQWVPCRTQECVLFLLHSYCFWLESCAHTHTHRGLLHCWCYNREWCSCGAGEKPYLCSLRPHYDELHLSRGCGMDMGWRLAGHSLRCLIHGLCRRAGVRNSKSSVFLGSSFT